MSGNIIHQIAHSLGRSDEEPNIRLAEKIAQTGNKADVMEAVSLLEHKASAVRSDAIKVMYEIAVRNVNLVLPFISTFIALLGHRDNRMKWGAMSALSAISNTHPAKLVDHLPVIVDAMDSGNVITRDHGIYILTNVAKIKAHHEDCVELLLEQLQRAPVNQVPMYAEKTATIITKPYYARFEKILTSRNDVLEISSKKKRIDKLLMQLKS